MPLDVSIKDGARALVIAYLLELGIIIHSVLIGVDLGITHETKELRPLFIAICFHQFFEGIGLGAALSVAKVSRVKGWILAIMFSIATPVGIAIGIGVESTFDHEAPRTAWTIGVLGSLASGVLIYSGLVQMIVEDFNRCAMGAYSKKLWMCVAMLVGYACMTVLAKWA